MLPDTHRERILLPVRSRLLRRLQRISLGLSVSATNYGKPRKGNRAQSPGRSWTSQDGFRGYIHKLHPLTGPDTPEIVSCCSRLAGHCRSKSTCNPPVTPPNPLNSHPSPHPTPPPA